MYSGPGVAFLRTAYYIGVPPGTVKSHDWVLLNPGRLGIPVYYRPDPLNGPVVIWKECLLSEVHSSIWGNGRISPTDNSHSRS